MRSLDEKADGLVSEINALYDSVSKEKWNELNKTGFIFEMERSTKKLKEIFQDFSDIERELLTLLEKNAPGLGDFLEEFGKELTVLESNLKMEKQAKWKENIVNENESFEVPELHSAMQEKVLSLALKSRYSAERVSTFVNARRVPTAKKGSTAKNLLEMLDKREQEISDLKARQADMKRRSFLGFIEERNIAEIEREVNEVDKELATNVAELKNALKIHLSQMEYLEGSFAQLKEKVESMEEMHYNFSRKALDLVKEMKKERDFAKKIALDIEQETMKLRGDYTNQLLGIEETKQAIKDRVRDRYEKELKELREKNEELKGKLKGKKG